ncbi:MAG: nucleotide exchange factor GrpE [Pseudomonadota bacterium]|nr:nucleotide exchange factor GrpE [Pseudomonadota bacterium]
MDEPVKKKGRKKRGLTPFFHFFSRGLRSLYGESENITVKTSEDVPVTKEVKEVDEITAGIGRGSDDDGSSIPDWRRQIEEQCQSWLDSLEEKPPIEPEKLPPEVDVDHPDLYGFYAELCAVRHEFRKQSRRTNDGLSRFGGVLDEFEEVISRLQARLDQADEAKRQAEDMEVKRAVFLPLVDLFDRFQRLEKRLAVPPPMGFFAVGRRRRQAWENVGDGFAILRDHFAALLRQAEVEPVQTVGQVFDPGSMKVVAVEETAAAPADVVLAELAAGYRYRGWVLRLAEVKVAKNKKSNENK